MLGPVTRERAARRPLDLSIVVVTWNGKKFVDENFGSILADLRGLSAEVIAVDNASTDGTAEMIAERYPEVELIRSPTNLGFARGNNLAIRKSREIRVLGESRRAHSPGVLPNVSRLPGAEPKIWRGRAEDV